MDKGKIKISAINLMGNDLPDVKVSLEDNGTLYTFNGMYGGSRAISSKLLRLMENDETDTKGADK